MLNVVQWEVHNITRGLLVKISDCEGALRLIVIMGHSIQQVASTLQVCCERPPPEKGRGTVF